MKFALDLINKVLRDDDIRSKTRDLLLDDEINEDYETSNLFKLNDELHRLAIECGFDYQVEFK